MKEEHREHKGLGTLVLVFILVLIGYIILLDLDYDIIRFLNLTALEPFRLIVIALIIVGSVWIFLWIVGRVFEKLGYARVGSYGQVRSIWKLISYIIWALVFIVLILGLMGDMTSTALSVGLFGAALAFVLQKPLLNIAGWIFITYHRMYKTGDHVLIGHVRGYIVDIRLMYTEFMEFGEWMQGDTYTGRIVLVPNSLIFDGPIHNYTRDSPYIWDEVTNLVTYESDIDIAKKYMLEAAREVVGDMMHQNYEKYRRMLSRFDLDVELLNEPKLRMELKDSGVNLYVIYWCPVKIRRKIKTQIVEKIWHKFMSDSKVGIAYPHLEIVRHRESWGDLKKRRGTGLK